MAITIGVITAVFLAGIVLGALFLWRRSRRPDPPRGGRLPFRKRYVALPAAILLISLALTLFFYGQLPDEVAYRFTLDGSPGGFLDRVTIVAVIIGAQLFLVVAAGLITWAIAGIRSLAANREQLWVDPDRLLLFMGNMPAIPQLILAFALADIFSYNAYEVHIMPLWLFALIVIVVGAVVLGIFAVPVFLRALRGLNQTGGNQKEQ